MVLGRRVVVLQVLLVAGVVLLYAGCFIRLGRSSPFGRDDAVALVGAVLALAALALALTQRLALRVMGGVVAALGVAVIVEAFLNQHFAIVGVGDDAFAAQLVILALVPLGLVVMLMPGRLASVPYLAALIVAVVIAFRVGLSSDEKGCRVTGEGCEMVGLSAFVWAGIVYLAGLLVIVVVEAGRTVLRRHRRPTATPAR